MKENDYFLNVLENPNFDPRDFRNVGLTTENTSLEDKKTYKELEAIRNNKLFLTDGLFDEVKFDLIYDLASNSFKVFSNSDLIDKISSDKIFSKYDIFAPIDKRNDEEEEFKIVRTINPLRERRGLIHTTDIQESPYSVRENAQTQLVYDGATKKWLESPNDSFWENFTKTLVLAQWDEDGTHKDPITGQLVKHQKGEKKLNENGTYYYETLNGRDIYGREVLSKFDTLTTDGSAWNKLDFFDSDDKKKSIAGTLVKDVIKVAPAFIPGVSPWYIGARMVLNVTELLAKVGKIFGGNDNPTLSAVEGIAKSLSFSSSDYAQGSQEAGTKAHVWSMENILNMAGDVFLQLAELRWLFEYGPSLLMGSAGYDDAARLAMQKDIIIKKNKQLEKFRLENVLKNGVEKAEHMQAISNALAVDEVMEAYMKLYNTIGKYISQVYMTGIVAADAYGDAKLEGLTDEEASALTIGYALLEYGLLSTDVGKWVLPELKSQRLLYRQLVKTLLHDPNRKVPDYSTSTLEKTKWLKRLVNKGREFAQATYDPTASAIKTAIGGALSEGVEETSEELLYDLSKSLFNLSKLMQGEEPKLKTFDDVFNRYALSFVGGALGGGLMTVRSDYRQAKTMASLDKQKAYQMLVHLVDLDLKDEFMRTARKMIWDSKDLAPVIDGVDSYKSGNPQNNRNIAALDALQQEVDMIESVLKANGGTISDDSLMKFLTNSDKRFRLVALLQSQFMPTYLLEFNTLQTKILDKSYAILGEYKKLEELKKHLTSGDSSADKSKAYEDLEKQTEQTVKGLRQELKELVEQKLEFTSGKKNIEYIKKAAFEMSEDVSKTFIAANFINYAQAREHTTIDKIAPERLAVLRNDWAKEKETITRQDLELAYELFEKVNISASDLLKNHLAKYFENKNVFTILLDTFSRVTDVDATEKQVILSGNLGQGQVFDKNELIYDVPSIKLSLNENFSPSTNGIALLYYQLANKLNKEVINTEGMSDKDLAQLYKQQVFEMLKDGGVEYLIQQVDEAAFITAPEKQFLLETLKEYNKQLNPEYNPSMTAEDVRLSNHLNALHRKIELKHYSPITDLMDKWNITTKANWKTSDLIKFLEETTILGYLEGRMKELTVGEDISEAIHEAIGSAKLLRAAILAARTDNVHETNLVGYNILINSIDSESDLATINKYDADVILLDLNKVITTLEYYKLLNALNTNLKLKENSKLDVKITYLLYDKIKALINAPEFPPKDWEGAEELKLAFNSLELLSDSNFERTLDLDLPKAVQLKRDKIKFENSLHEFLKKNENRDLYDLFNENKFYFGEPDTEVLNLESETISDTKLMFYISSVDVIGGSDFYKLYLHSIPDRLAPLPGQELAIRLGLASVLDGARLAKYVNAHTQAVNKTTLGRDFDNSRLDSDVSIDFLRTILIDGIAGSGKTTAVMLSVFSMLRNVESAKHLLDEVWFVNTTKERAIQMAKNMGYSDEAWLDKHCFSREEVLKEISQEYVDKKFTNKGLDLIEENLTKGDRFYRWKYSINKSRKAPSLIVFDEVGGFAQQDMLLIDDFSEYYGIMNLASGDFDLVTLRGKLTKETRHDDGSIETLEIEPLLYSGNFIGSWKLGVSMRADSRLIDSNQKSLRANLKDLRAGNNIPPLRFKYYDNQGQSPVLGWYNADSAFDYDELKEKIELYLQEAKRKKESGAKPEEYMIGYAHDDVDNDLSEIMLELQQEYPDLIKDEPGGLSQGNELDYYIVNFGDFDENNKEAYWELAYTGLTRAKKGVIFNLVRCAESIHSDDISEYSLGATEIANYQRKYKEIVKEALGDDLELPKIQYKKFGGTVTPQSETSEAKVSEGVMVIADDSKYTVVKVTDSEIILEDEDGNPITKTIDEFNEEDFTIITSDLGDGEFDDDDNFEEYNQNKYVKVVNDKPDQLNMVLHSMATHETGAIEDNNGILQPSFDHQNRRDSINGIIYLCNLIGLNINLGNQTSQLLEKLLLILDEIKSELLYDNFTGESLRATFEFILGEEYPDLDYSKLNDVDLEFRFKCTPTANNKPLSFTGLIKSYAEKLRKIFSKKEKAKEVTLKHITAEITDKTGKKVLEIPLLNLSNFNSLVNTLPQQALLVINNTTGTVSLKLQALIDYVHTNNPNWPMPNVQIFETFKALWEEMNSGLDFVIVDNSGNPIKKLSDLGGEYLGMSIVNKIKGENGKFEYDGEYVSIKEYKERTNNLVSPIYGAAVPVTSVDDKVIIPAGKPFVLISDNLSNAEGSLLRDYIDYHRNPRGKKDPGIKLVRIVPPAAPLEDYLISFHTITSGTKSKATRKSANPLIGTELTNFRLLKMIFEDPNNKFRETLKQRISMFDLTSLDEYLADYDAFKEEFTKKDGLIEQYTKARYKKDFINFLRDSKDLSDFCKDLKHVPNGDSWKKVLNYYFKFLVLGTYDDTGKFKYSTSAPLISDLENLMKSNKWDGIYYHLTFSKESTDYIGVKLMDYDINNPTFPELPAMINGKVDSQSWVADTSMILESYKRSKVSPTTTTQTTTPPSTPSSLVLEAPESMLELAKKLAKLEMLNEYTFLSIEGALNKTLLDESLTKTVDNVVSAMLEGKTPDESILVNLFKLEEKVFLLSDLILNVIEDPEGVKVLLNDGRIYLYNPSDKSFTPLSGKTEVNEEDLLLDEAFDSLQLEEDLNEDCSITLGDNSPEDFSGLFSGNTEFDSDVPF